MKVFVSGGCKNGKSTFAQKLAKDIAEREGKKLYYVATMISKDEEDEARIAKHIEDRAGWGFETIEEGHNISNIVRNYSSDGVFLFDSITAYLENKIFDEKFNIKEDAPKEVAEEIKAFAKEVSFVVFVSDYIYSDAITYEESTESYKKALAYVDRAIAKDCDEVYEIAFGSVEKWK